MGLLEFGRALLVERRRGADARTRRLVDEARFAADGLHVSAASAGAACGGRECVSRAAWGRQGRGGRLGRDERERCQSAVETDEGDGRASCQTLRMTQEYTLGRALCHAAYNETYSLSGGAKLFETGDWG